MYCLKNKFFSFLLVFTLFVGIVGVINVDTTYAASKNVHLKKTTVTVDAGKTYQQKLIDKNSKTISASKVKWKSSKTSVAKINKKGKITAVKAGTAKMTAKYEGKTYSFKVRVIGLKESKVSLISGDIYQQKLINYNGKTITPSSVKWKSSKPSVAKINKKGKITAAKAGTAKMTAKYKGKTYKFTVKVNKPFKSGEKPTGLKLYYYDDFEEIDLTWDGPTNTKKYQIYASKDGGAYKLIGSSDETYYEFTDVTEGTKYSFKVRAICGQYKSPFSKVKTITIPESDEEGNTSISFDPDTLALLKGDSKTVEVITDKGARLTCETDNNNVSCTWGDWNANTCILNITGKAIGSSIITVYDAEDNSVKAELTVNVYSYLDLLQYYIDTEGYTNGNGDKTVKYVLDSDKTVYFINHDNTIEFDLFSYYNTSEFDSSTYVSMEMEVPEDSMTAPIIRVEIGDYYFEAHSYVTTSDYDKSDELYFYRDSGNTPTSTNIQDLCNSSFRLAMNSWEIALVNLLGVSMNDLGFVNY